MENYNHNQMPDIEITQDDILRMLETLNPNQDAGPDQILSILLKEMSKEIAHFLTLTF